MRITMSSWRVSRPRGEALALLVLLVLAGSAHALAARYCDELFKEQGRGGGGGGGGARVVMRRGREMRVSLVWGSAPARAGAALLRALLAGALRYRGVTLAPRSLHRLVDLAPALPYSPVADYTELVLVVSAAWAGEHNGALCLTSSQTECGVAGPRLRDFGASSIPARARLHAHLVPAGHWPSNTNATWLGDYHHLTAAGAQIAVVYYPAEDAPALNRTLLELCGRAAAAALPLRPHPLPRAKLFLKLRSNKESFLFLDFDMWAKYTNVRPVRPPPCVDAFTCREDLDPSEALRAVDSFIVTKCAPRLFDTFHKFQPKLQSLREILEAEEEAGSAEEAACGWALNHTDAFAELIRSTSSVPMVYNVIVSLCKDDIDLYAYIDLMKRTWEIKLRSELNYQFGIDPLYINCDEPKAAIAAVESYMTKLKGLTAIGLVASGEVEAAALAAFGARHHLPLVLYDSPADDIDAADTQHAPVWSSVGRLRHLARAVRRVAAMQNWTRLAVLSDTTPLARDFFDALNDDVISNDRIVLGDFSIRPDLSQRDAITVLEKLRNVNARIVFVNARADIAAAVLSAAAAGGMMHDQYAWLVRDWPPARSVSDVTRTVISISYWCRSEEGVAAGEGAPELRAEMSRLWRAREWPPRAVALVDAILTIAYGFQEVMRRNSSTVEYDLRTVQTITEFKKVMMAGFTEPGVLRELRYEASMRARASPLVYVGKWSGEEHTPLGQCRVEDDRVNCTLKPVYRDGAPADGASGCVMRSEDQSFAPGCYDIAWVSALVAAAVAMPGGWLARRAVLRRLAKRDRHLLLLLLARRERAAEALGAHLVPRSAVELREELGVGSFGRVQLALLRSGGRARVVAAKSLREGAAPSEESEFLREACTLAALEHEHVVRLAGVCADDGPPLVLMEHAFFGDLLRYLRARRHLAEATPDGAEEAKHVGPEALTRLAREAASALSYLALRGLVHRDVRAANCLVDARRSLKLADFGMARETAAAGADGAAEYACRRRALFPVLWMAPESLLRGVFSAASDVWAFGVLVLELVTLGERPYGDMSPLRVLQFVIGGGRPPLPLDTTPQTRGVALACWQRTGEQRPAAPELVSYLAAHPRALRAALHAPRPEPAGCTDADSGFGEPASADLLPPEHCLGLDGLDCAVPR